MLKQGDFVWHKNVLIHKYYGRVISLDESLRDQQTVFFQSLRADLDLSTVSTADLCQWKHPFQTPNDFKYALRTCAERMLEAWLRKVA